MAGVDPRAGETPIDPMLRQLGLETDRLEVARAIGAAGARFDGDIQLREPCRERLVEEVFKVSDLITFFTSDEKEVHAWLLG